MLTAAASPSARFRFLEEAINEGYAERIELAVEDTFVQQDHPKYWWKKVNKPAKKVTTRIIVRQPFFLWFHDHWMLCDEIGREPIFGTTHFSITTK